MGGVLFGGNAKLDQMIVFVDYNKQQFDAVDDINPLGNLKEMKPSAGMPKRWMATA